MADYIYMMESRLSPEQQKGVNLVVETARAHDMNTFLTGGTIRDIVSGFPIRDLDFTVEGNPLKLHRDLEKAGAAIEGEDEYFRELYLQLPGNVRAAINMARSEKYEKPGKLPELAAAAIMEDLRRRDFSVNAIALSLNPGSRGLLLDPSNGLADIEAKHIRILHNYSFFEDPSRLIRATRFLSRFHWTIEERTQARYNAALENGYIEHITNRAIGQEIEQLAYEDEPIHVLKALEKEGWLKVLHPHWTVAKVDAAGLGQLLKTRQQMSDLGYTANIAAAVLYFLTARMSERESTEMQKHIPRRGLVRAWHNLESEAKALSQKLNSKEAATPSRTWQLLSHARPDTIAFLEVISRQQGVTQKIRNFLSKWRQIKQRFPLPEMSELRITPDHPEYSRLVDEMFFLMLDGKLRSSSEIVKFLKPYSPPPPPPPPPPRRGRGAKAAEAIALEKAGPGPETTKGRGRKKKGVRPPVAEEIPAAVAAKAPTSEATPKSPAQAKDTGEGKPTTGPGKKEKHKIGAKVGQKSKHRK